MTIPTPAKAMPDLAAAIEKLLACPRSHRPLTVSGASITCAGSDFSGTVRDGVAMMMPSTQVSFFDDKFEVMRRGHEGEGEWNFCYQQQTQLLASYLQAGQVVLDVGCGPSLPYAKPPGSVVVGLEPSFRSIHANQQVDLRVYGSATDIPMADGAVDLVVCFYSLHHMVGSTREETAAKVGRAFSEFGRVLKPGGTLFVFEMTPITLFTLAQRASWNAARRLAPGKLDMYFWSASSLAEMGRRFLPPATTLEKIFFGASAFTVFPPIFSLPWLKVPRVVFPLDPKLYKWRKAGPVNPPAG
jgi:ubiquinone/menaquinone biosynthesis C-methylase UbiE